MGRKVSSALAGGAPASPMTAAATPTRNKQARPRGLIALPSGEGRRTRARKFSGLPGRIAAGSESLACHAEGRRQRWSGAGAALERQSVAATVVVAARYAGRVAPK